MFIESVQHIIGTYGLPGIFFSLAIESIGVPFPTEAAFLVSNQLISNGIYGFWFIFALMVMAQTISSIVAYGLGTLINNGVIKQIKAKKLKETSQKVTNWYERYGSVTVFATRLIGYVRPWASIVAGLAGFSFWPFVLWTILGSSVYVFFILTITKYLVKLWLIYPILQPIIVIGIIISFFSFFFVGIFNYFRGKRL